MEHVNSILVGVASSLTASFLFLLVLARLRPRILISDKIAKVEEQNGETWYSVKILNRTRFDLIKVFAEFHIVTPKKKYGGYIIHAEKLDLIRSEVLVLSKFDASDKEAKYAFRFRSTAYLEKDWVDQESYIRFRVYAAHSLSGFGKVFSKDYYDKEVDIVSGDFEYGNSLRVISSPR